MPTSPAASAKSDQGLPMPIVVQGLSHWFGKGEARKQALFDIDLAVERGKLTVLLGASGSGKTRAAGQRRPARHGAFRRR
jgi:ABC-type glutathione transport system ATPase component